MYKIIITLFGVLYAFNSNAQVAEMNWELDYQIYLKLANDSNYTYDIREAFHVKDIKEKFTSNYVFYPVNPGQQFANEVPASISGAKYNTLWGALHAKVGGGWVHFMNCVAYALETKKMSLTAPLMKRPASNWKPKPMTESYKRTKNWEYYVPYSQKNAQKEYKNRLKKEDVGDLKSLPESYIELFMDTNQKEYEQLVADEEYDKLAKIDLVKVILGSNFLGEAQITYMSNSVLDAVRAYSSNMLPSVIIFDEFDAAAVMTLTPGGYKIENVVFKASSEIPEIEAQRRRHEIGMIVSNINEYNRNSFKKRLGNYYKEK